ncbi:hypothetical protein N9D23_00480 [Rubripirellula sp.]|nr:hypothetical protein [Rubripirellula sp.]
MTALFVAAYLATPLVCWLLNSFLLKRRVQRYRLFIYACIVGYLVLMLVVASHAVKDAFERQNVDVGVVFGEGEASDAGLALAPLLGIPVTIVWTAINFIAFSVIEWCYRTDFRSAFGEKNRPRQIAENESTEAIDS